MKYWQYDCIDINLIAFNLISSIQYQKFKVILLIQSKFFFIKQ